MNSNDVYVVYNHFVLYLCKHQTQLETSGEPGLMFVLFWWYMVALDLRDTD